MARILEMENAETLGSPESSWVIGFGFASTVRAELSGWVSVETAKSELLISSFVSSITTSTTGVFSATCLTISTIE
ncbi:hypothetical protein [Flavobacterium soyangense]|uniref:Uncharacterized protein n=1 Tax=Flavobacterium soyangense TaxID=2023265 RepID=A0A930XWJ9_9FLAO|nr:hypothetical protein [Flavobacterium soyangense]MBF2709262.1 hypothetical protein [Flavobacterium soyangense]